MGYVLVILLTLLACVYVALQLVVYWRGHRAINSLVMPDGYAPFSIYQPQSAEPKVARDLTQPHLSVIVAARNEALRIGPLLEALRRQDYPADHWQWIIVDDHSDDDTAAVVRPFLRQQDLLLCLPQGQQGKKAALQYGAQQAQGELLLFTDADVAPPPHWVRRMVAAYGDAVAVVVTAPVQLSSTSRWLGRLQQLDMAASMWLTAAATQGRWFHLGNGANWSVRRRPYLQMQDAYHDRYSSGDDVFVVQQLAEAYPGLVKFSSDPQTMVTTPAVRRWRGFWQQRLRWASKTTAYPQQRLTALWGFLYIFHVLLIGGTVAALFQPHIRIFILLIWLLKLGADYVALRQAVRYFGDRRWLSNWLPVWLLHSLYIVTIGTASLVGEDFFWKGRRHRI